MPEIPSAAFSDARIIAAYIIFLASYLVFALGKFPGFKIDRPGAAIIGAVAMVAARVVSPAQALHFIDFSTIVLLFSMMLIVGNLHLVGFFEWIAEVVLRRLRPARLLPAVIFTSGIFSAFFVNDIVCLVMVPFVLSITRRMKVAPLPYLLAVATASNIGSVATITGNPQNMLIGSFSGIKYRDFLEHLAPVAVMGLLIDWAVLHRLHMRAAAPQLVDAEVIPLPALDASRLTKPTIVVTAVLVGFFMGVPPAQMAALGAALLLKSLVPGFADPHTAWLVLAMASTLAGNLTITGSVANIIVVETAKPEIEIGFRDYFRVGLPITVATLIIGWAWLAWVK